MNTKSLASAVGVVLLAITGCKQEEGQREQTTVRETESESVGEIRRQAGRAFEEAKTAQEEAQAKQEELAEAERVVQQKQTELQRARQTVSEKRNEAQQAVRRAEEEAQRAAQVAEQSGRQAEQIRTRTERELATTTSVPEQTATGRVLTADESVLVIERQGEPPLRLQLDEQTAVTLREGSGTAADIPPGSEVRAAYRVEGDQPIAVRIEEIGASEQQPVRGEE